jgi:hypothetical protein
MPVSCIRYLCAEDCPLLRYEMGHGYAMGQSVQAHCGLERSAEL